MPGAVPASPRVATTRRRHNHAVRTHQRAQDAAGHETGLPTDFAIAATVHAVDRLRGLAAAAAVRWTSTLGRLDRDRAPKSVRAIVRFHRFVRLQMTHLVLLIEKKLAATRERTAARHRATQLPLTAAGRSVVPTASALRARGSRRSVLMRSACLNGRRARKKGQLVHQAALTRPTDAERPPRQFHQPGEGFEEGLRQTLVGQSQRCPFTDLVNRHQLGGRT